jgi:hypothetical protein
VLLMRKILMFFFAIIIFSGCQSDSSMPSTPNKEITPKSSELIHNYSSQIESDNDNQRTQLKKDKKQTNNNKPEIKPKAKNKPSIVKGIYVPPTMVNQEKIKPLIELINQSELNAMVIDVKTDSGHLTYQSNRQSVKKFHTVKKTNNSLKSVLGQLKEQKIYTIARVVTFKDPHLAGKKTEWAMHTHSGGLWRDGQGVSWVDPYNTEVWDYNIEIANEAAELGFDEIQFDYIRFPDSVKKLNQEVEFSNPNQWSKAEVVEQFLKRAHSQINHDIFISADVFGLTTTTKDDMGIGQQWGKIVQNVDYVSPMVYPSHYSSGMYGINHPDLEPYDLIKQAMTDALEKNNKMKKQGIKTAEIRPWLQSFTASWIEPHQQYGPQEIKNQIKAAKELGVEQYLLWNPLGKYEMK